MTRKELISKIRPNDINEDCGGGVKKLSLCL